MTTVSDPTPTPDTAGIRAFLDERHTALAERAAEVCRDAIGPRPPPTDDDAARAEARHIAEILGQTGLLGVVEPLDLRGCCIVREALAATSPLADTVFALQALGSMPLLLADDEAARERWAGPALEGRAIAAFAMTEPEAGSDVASMRTRARADGDGYVLDGTKTLISNAGIADFYAVFASTDPGAGRRGISCFVVPADAPGLRFARPLVMSEPHPLGEIALEGCRVPRSARLGEEGGGFRLGMAALDRLRPTVAAAACGMARRALDEALRHVARREQFGKRLADLEVVRDRLARMAIELDAARLLTYRAAAELDRGAQRITLEAAMAKAFATEAAQRVVDGAVQLVGGRGVLADSVVDRLYRAVRALRIYEGATEVQHQIVAGQLLRGIES